MVTPDGKPAGVQPPASVEFAAVETGAPVRLPPFVNTDDRTKVKDRERRSISWG